MSRNSLLIGLYLGSAWFLAVRAEQPLPKLVNQFIDLNCFDCHNEVDKKGGLDLKHTVLDCPLRVLALGPVFFFKFTGSAEILVQHKFVQLDKAGFQIGTEAS